jgi:hypothetical protein
MHARNAVHFANIHTVDLGHAPTRWQRDTFPESFHPKLFVGHDGIRTDILTPDPDATVSLGRLDRPLTREDEVLTYVARNLEPTRGFHIFMRALPEILDARPRARALIVGGNGTSYGKASEEPGGYRAAMEREVGDRIDWDRVHFLGRVPYASYRSLLQISRCHVYLTVPFVLSWSLLEAMSMGATVVASDVAPVREVMEHGKTGLFVDFFDPPALPRQVAEVLANPGPHCDLGRNARATLSKPTTSTPARCRRMSRRSTILSRAPCHGRRSCRCADRHATPETSENCRVLPLNAAAEYLMALGQGGRAKHRRKGHLDGTGHGETAYSTDGRCGVYRIAHLSCPRRCGAPGDDPRQFLERPAQRHRPSRAGSPAAASRSSTPMSATPGRSIPLSLPAASTRSCISPRSRPCPKASRNRSTIST